jgi:hypothetical protein
LAYVPNRKEAIPLGFVSKILPLPHLKAALFARGQQLPVIQAAAEFMTAPHVSSLEDAAILLGMVLRTFTAAYADQHDIDDWTAVGMIEAYLIGYSDEKSRMRLYRLTNMTGYRLEPDNDYTGTIACSFPELPEARKPKLDGLSPEDQCVALIKAERDYFAAEPEAMCGAFIGGEIVSWSIDPAGAMAYRVLHRFEDYEQQKNAGAAITGRIQGGLLKVNLRDALVPTEEMRDLAAEAAVAGAKARASIKPAAAAPGMSRAERRRAEALARRRSGRAA